MSGRDERPGRNYLNTASTNSFNFDVMRLVNFVISLDAHKENPSVDFMREIVLFVGIDGEQKYLEMVSRFARKYIYDRYYRREGLTGRWIYVGER